MDGAESSVWRPRANEVVAVEAEVVVALLVGVCEGEGRRLKRGWVGKGATETPDTAMKRTDAAAPSKAASAAAPVPEEAG